MEVGVKGSVDGDCFSVREDLYSPNGVCVTISAVSLAFFLWAFAAIAGAFPR
jgi:hypothetical protein